MGRIYTRSSTHVCAIRAAHSTIVPVGGAAHVCNALDSIQKAKKKYQSTGRIAIYMDHTQTYSRRPLDYICVYAVYILRFENSCLTVGFRAIFGSSCEAHAISFNARERRRGASCVVSVCGF